MFKNILVLLIGVVSLVYLVNPTAGILEFIPDNLPIVGNLDEAAATTLLVASLRYFGVDLAHIFRKEKKADK